MTSRPSSPAHTFTIVAAISVGVILACARPQLVKSGATGAETSKRQGTVFTDTALFRRICLEADSGLTPAVRRCTPRDQRVRVQ